MENWRRGGNERRSGRREKETSRRTSLRDVVWCLEAQELNVSIERMMMRMLGGARGQAGLRKMIEQSKVNTSRWSRGAERD